MPLLPTGTESVVRQHPYEKFSLALFGGADPDSSDASRQPGWFSELHNMRFETPGTPVTRSGIKQFIFRDTTPPDTAGHTVDAGPLVPLWCCEYAVWHAGGDTGSPQTGVQKEYRYDVTLLYEKDQHTFKLRLLDKRLRDGTALLITLPATFTPPTPYADPSGCVWQFGDNLIVSIFDVTTCMAWPTTWPPTNDWSIEILGKDVCPTPTKYDFPQTLQGDLLVFGAHQKANETAHVMEYDTFSPTDPSKVVLRLPINADYVRSGWLPPGGVLNANSQAIVDTQLVPRWKVANVDAAGAPASRSVIQHLQHRGYFYRFIRVRTIKDAEGSPVKLRSNASVDIFVPAVNYSPFFWYEIDAAANKSYPYEVIKGGKTNGGWTTVVPPFRTAGVLSTTPIPSIGAWNALVAKYRAYFNVTSLSDTGGAGGGLLWAATWLGWQQSDADTYFNLLTPWQTDVSAEELLSSPQTMFAFADFPGIDPTDVIEVYRTAYEDVDPVKRPVTTPLFQPHVYGLVGTIAFGEVFTDATKIPDFGADPSHDDGYLRGQFSGDVIYDYGQSPAVTLGNIRSDYRVLDPSPLVQAFFYDTNKFTLRADLIGNAGDGLPAWAFYFAYEDRLGYRSAAVRVDVDVSNVAHQGAIGFTFPMGYDPNIAKIVLYLAAWRYADGGHPNPPYPRREYVELTTIAPEPGTYVFAGDITVDILGSHGTYGVGPFSAAIPAGDNPKFYEPGAIIYSNPDAPWDWPQSQIEKHHASAPVRCIKEMMGELAIVTDESFTLTLLRKEVPRSERNTAALGCISKHAHAKVNDAEVILTQHGLYFLVPSRPEELESHMDIEVLPRLIEQIPQLLGLANLRGASMGYMARRKELFFHIPSSRDLWPLVDSYPNPKALAHRTFIFNFTGGLRKMENYDFDISPDFEIKNLPQDDLHPITTPAVDRTTFNAARVLFSPGMDGTLYCSYADRNGTLITIDCDDPDSDYQGAAYGTIALGLLDPAGQKQIAATEVLMQARGVVQVMSGPPKITGGWDAIRGAINDKARVAAFQKIRVDTPKVYWRPATDDAMNTKGSTVMFRIRTTPDDSQRHRVELRALTIYYDDKHQHN